MLSKSRYWSRYVEIVANLYNGRERDGIYGEWVRESFIGSLDGRDKLGKERIALDTKLFSHVFFRDQQAVREITNAELLSVFTRYPTSVI